MTMGRITFCFCACLTLVMKWAGAVQAADPVPVAQWNFGEEEQTPLHPRGGVHRDIPGPRSPEYPDFDPGNTAVRLDGNGAYLYFEDPGIESSFDFTNGDQITLEAWVQLDDIRAGENVYIIGKGRTGSRKFAQDNQNWALRVREQNGSACVSFLFATPPSDSGSHWHRWTTTSGFRPGPAWHHIAVSYTFGKPESIRAWIDGKPQKGKWDMGGPTKEPPVVDDDAIWIGSSMGGSPSASFRGSLDSIAIYRQQLGDSIMTKRFRRVGEEPKIEPAPEVAPNMGDLPTDEVLITFHEGMPSHDRWLNTNEQLPAETLRWTTDSLLMDRLPQRFDAWGIRDAWTAPVLVRFATEVQLTPGKHRFLMRTRGLSRLWVNEELIARGKAVRGSPSGEEPVTPVAAPPLPGMRIVEHRQNEILGEATIGEDGRCRIILETLVGGARFRTDPGETCVAVESDDQTCFFVITPSAMTSVPLTDEAFTAALKRQLDEMSRFDDERRRLAAASQDGFWKKRHNIARQWAKEHPAPQPPEKTAATHPVDAFLQAKIQRALAASNQTPLEEARQFHQEILPILRDNCFRCHGDKQNGGLVLNSLEGARRGGDSGLPAVTPGDLHKSELISRIRSEDPDERMPPGSKGLSEEQIALLEDWVKKGANWPAPPVTEEDVRPTRVLKDEAFLRRLALDTIGVVPSEDDLRAFLIDPSPDKRRRAIDRYLDDPRWADHWMGYWQDVLAENPTLINTSLNTTGPFRWYLYDSLKDNKPFDRLVTELILLRGNAHEGGSAGFGIAGNNDAPYAAKGQIVAGAFLGIELQCARCHDSPYHSTLQKDLYALAAMFERKNVTVPKSSRVPAAFFEAKARESLIKATLKPNEAVPPVWPFAEATGCVDDEFISSLMMNPKDTRERLATLITSPSNQRFAEVMVNRIWRRFIGSGIVEPPSDWEGRRPSHPELLKWLAQEFISHGYDVKHVSRLILTSDLYQREGFGCQQSTDPELRFFASPDRRRMTAEQIVDSLCEASGQLFASEELTFDPDARRPASNRLTLGVPTRAWMFANLANERDRPSLNLPRARTITDVMEAFGWSGARQNPRTDRETAPNVLQPGVMENSIASVLLTRATPESGLAELAMEATSPEELVDSLFLRYLSRLPTEEERDPLARALAENFQRRILPADQVKPITPPEPLPVVTWSNHLRQESNSIAIEQEARARAGVPGDPRLLPSWRETYEDVVWSLVNLSEFIWVP